MKIGVVILAILSFATAICKGQDTTGKYFIKGKLLSRNNKVEFDFPSIVLLNDVSHKKQSDVIFDAFGNFYADQLPPGNYTLQISAQGEHMNDTTITIKDRSLKKLVLYGDVVCDHYDAKVAYNDILIGKPRLLLQGGIAPVLYRNQPIFEQKYNVGYYDFGCIRSDAEDCIISYNKVIFSYLDSTYGKKWRKEVRKDVIGLNQ